MCKQLKMSFTDRLL